MGWKTINGRRCYYKSERAGGRVKSTCFGAGETGSLMAEMVALERLERAADWEELQEQRGEFMAEETSLSCRRSILRPSLSESLMEAAMGLRPARPVITGFITGLPKWPFPDTAFPREFGKRLETACNRSVWRYNL